MKNKTFLRIMAAAVVTGASLGALVMVVPQFTWAYDGPTRILIDVAAALIGGGIILGYAKFVKWERSRSKHDS